MAITLINNTTGKSQEVRDDEVHMAVSSGAFSFDPGTEIPVRDPETGEVQSIPSENVGEAFKSGYTLPSMQERQVSTDRAMAESLQKSYNEAPGTAALGGALSSLTMGGSDLALRAVAPELANRLGKVEEASPTATALGNVAGFVAPGAIGWGAGKLGMSAVKGAMELTGAGATTAAREAVTAKLGLAVGEQATKSAAQQLASTTAKNIAAKAFNGALGSAVEGALVSGQGLVTEASLGDPNEVAEHWLSSLAMGAVIGGAAGGAFELAAPAARKSAELVGRGLSRSFDKVEGVVEDLGLKLAGEKGQMAKELRPMWQETQDAARTWKAQESQLNTELSTVAKEGRKSAEELNTLMRVASKESQLVADTFEEASAKKLLDFRTNMQAVGNDIKKDTIGKIPELANLPKAGIYQKSVSALDDASAKFADMAAKGDPSAKRFINELDEIKNAKMWAQDVTTDAEQHKAWLMTEGAGSLALDVAPAYAAKQALGDLAASTTDKAAKKILWDAYDGVKSAMYSSEDVAKLFSPWDGHWSQYYKVKSLWQSAIEKRMGPGHVGNLKKAMSSMSDDNAAMEVLGMLRESVPHMPEAQKIIDENVAARALRKEADTFSAKTEELTTRARIGEATPEELVQHIIDQGYGDKLPAKWERNIKASDALKKIRDTMPPDATPVDIMLALKKEMGIPIADDLARMQELGPSVEKFKRLQEMIQNSDSTVTNLVAGAAATAGGFAAGPLGASIAGGAGYLAGKAVANPINWINTFRTIDRAKAFSADKMSKATNALITGLTGQTAKRITVISTVQHDLKTRREVYRKQVEALRDTQGPVNRMKANIQSQVAPMAPKVAEALLNRVDAANQFLSSKAPSDPTAQNNIFANKTGYMPSDTELASWERYVNAVNHPDKVVEDLTYGIVSNEGLETMQTVYPTLFKQLQSNVLSAIMEQSDKLRYKDKLMLARVFNIPTDQSLSAGFLNQMQGHFVAENNGEQGGRPSGGAKEHASNHIKNANNLASSVMPATTNQRISNKGTV